MHMFIEMNLTRKLPIKVKRGDLAMVVRFDVKGIIVLDSYPGQSYWPSYHIH